MDRSEWVIQTKAKLLACEIEMQGMIALNKYREMRGETIAYDDTAFFGLIEKYDLKEIEKGI